MREQRILALIIGLFLVLGATYALTTPVFEASDELWHYPMVRHLADGNPLPVQVFDPAQAGPWKQEASQPPLYYYVAAALTFWIDTSDMEQIRWLNPHVDNGVLTSDGNINLVVHDPAAQPWQGTLLAVRVIRLASVLMGAATVFFTYLIARAAAPARPELWLGAAAVNAFMPMFLFISGAVNNDNLAIMLASWAVVLMIGTVAAPVAGRRHEQARALGLGVIVGLAVLTKEGALALIPLAWGTLFVRQWQLRRGTVEGPDASLTVDRLTRMLGGSFTRFGLFVVPVLVIAGWWYYRNVILYGDWLGWNAFIAVLGQRPQAASLAQLWDERTGFLMAYWGLFGGVNVAMWQPIYWILNGALAASVVGFVVYLWRLVREWHLGPLQPVTRFLGQLLDLVVVHFPLVVCLIFSAAVVYGLLDWASITWSSQGRLVFTAISALTVLLVLGLAGWLPQRAARWATGSLGVFLFVVAALAPFLWIRPAYDPATYFPERVHVTRPADVQFGDQLRLTGYAIESQELDTSVVRPGEVLDVVLKWKVLREMEKDWSVFVHLNDPVLEAPIAQRDMYHGQGLRPTTLLRADEELLTYYRVRVPDTAEAPGQLALAVGLYDYYSGERLATPTGSDAVQLATLVVEPGVSDDYANATSLNFGDEIELVGYQLSPRVVPGGQTLTLTLFWRPLQELETDYTFFAQVLDTDTTRWAAADVVPDGGTSSYPAGAVETLTLSLPVNPDAPPGVYPLVVGLYTQTPDGAFQRLQRVVNSRITMDNAPVLTKIRIQEP